MVDFALGYGRTSPGMFRPSLANNEQAPARPKHEYSAGKSGSAYEFLTYHRIR